MVDLLLNDLLNLYLRAFVAAVDSFLYICYSCGCTTRSNQLMEFYQNVYAIEIHLSCQYFKFSPPFFIRVSDRILAFSHPPSAFYDYYPYPTIKILRLVITLCFMLAIPSVKRRVHNHF